MLKRKILLFTLLIISIFSISLNTFASPSDIYMDNPDLETPEIKSEAAMLMDMKSGRVLYSKNAEQELFPASTTKIMTAVLALEYGNLADIVTANVSALAPITNEDSHMGILIGEELTLEQLLYGMMVYSANDAANVIATHISGTPENFVELMNQKAEEIGLSNTNFVNSYGIHDENHYTTAKDLATLARYAMKNEKFREIVGTSTYSIPATNKYTEERILPSTNLFMSTSRSAEFYNQAVTGIKTGYTKDAGYCLVTSVVYEETELLVVTLKSPDRSGIYTDTRTLFRMGFNNYDETTLAATGSVIKDSKVYEAKNDTRVALTVPKDIVVLLPEELDLSEAIKTDVSLPKTIKAPIKKGDVLGSIVYTYNGTEVGKADLIAANDVERNNLLYVYHIITGILTHPLFLIPAILVLILIILKHISIKKQEKLERMRKLQNARRARENSSPKKYSQKYDYSDLSRRRNTYTRHKK